MSRKTYTLAHAGFGIATVEDDERRLSRLLLWSTLVTLLTGLLWAGFFELDEITRAQGKVIPSSREQVIQSLDAGVLSELLVRAGYTREAPDGRVGQATRDAVKEAQMRLGLPADSYPTEALISALERGRR